MSILSVYHVSSPALPNKVLTHVEDIASTLAEQGITFSRLPATTPVNANMGHEGVIDAYRVQVDQLMTEHGHKVVEVISVEGVASAHAELMSEHRYQADELRFFVAGRGLWSLRIGEFVYAVLCEKNDVLCVPAGTPQWFDMGENPRLAAIRLFSDAHGKVLQPTGETLSGEFPGLDD